jgi:hypothetical protein
MKIKEALGIFEKLEMEVREGNDTIGKLFVNGQLVVWTKVPHKRGELKGNLPHLIRQQYHLNETQFKGLYDCTISKEEYVEILRRKNLLCKKEPNEESSTSKNS